MKEIESYLFDNMIESTKNNLEEMRKSFNNLIKENKLLKEEISKNKDDKVKELELEIKNLYENSLFVFNEEQREMIKDFQKENQNSYFEVIRNYIITTVEIKDYVTKNSLIIFEG